MNAKNCIVGNYQLEKIGKNKYELHYTGEGWSSVIRTKKQINKSNSFFDLWYNY